jgi:hypothetical protein
VQPGFAREEEKRLTQVHSVPEPQFQRHHRAASSADSYSSFPR